MMKTKPTANPAETIARLIHRLLREITSEPDKVKIAGVPVGRSYFFEVKPTRADMPRLVGEHGKTFRAFKAVVAMFGRRHGVDMQYQVVEPDAGNPKPLQPFRRQDTWDSKPTEELARDLANALLVHPVKLVRTQDMANYISVLTVVASDDEPIDNILALREPFATIFNAIGKIKGRVLQPDVIAERDQKAQPASGFAPIKIG